MAHIIKERTSLQDQSKRIWLHLGIGWIAAGLTLLLPLIFKGTLGIYFIPLTLFGVMTQLSWKSMIIFRGNAGERSVFKVLRKLPDDYYILNDVTVTVGNRKAQIDHIVVSIYGLYCVETKAHQGWIYGTEEDKNWMQIKKSEAGRAYRHVFYNPVTQNRVHCQRVASMLKEKLGVTIPVKSVVVFTSVDQLNVQTITPVVTTRQLNAAIRSDERGISLSEARSRAVIHALLGTDVACRVI